MVYEDPMPKAWLSVEVNMNKQREEVNATSFHQTFKLEFEFEMKMYLTRGAFPIALLMKQRT